MQLEARDGHRCVVTGRMGAGHPHHVHNDDTYDLVGCHILHHAVAVFPSREERKHMVCDIPVS
jgi:hypothetical protein